MPYNVGAHKRIRQHEPVSGYRESAELAAVALGLAARNTTNLVKAQIQGAANLERLLIGLDAITGSLDAANAQYRDLIEVSRLPGINIENSLRATLQLQALGKSGEESTRIIREFGNSLALAGTPPRELRQVINAIRQISGEGKILQEDLSIITTRIAPVIPLLNQAFGGTRAEDVRKFYDALGTPPSQQAQLFLEVMLEGLERLPRAGETAANAIENLFDTAGRVQAQIGSNFLPLVKEATAATEGALMSIERSPTAARNIASLEAFAGGLLGVTSAAAGLHAAIRFLGPSLLAFATGPVGIAAAAAGAAAGAYLAWEVNLTSATEAQLKSLETEKTRLQLFREVQGLIAEGDTTRLATREDALSKSVAAANKAYEDQVLAVSEARKALADYTQQTEQLRSSQGARSARGAERTALTLRDPSELEGGLQQAEARLNALNRARLAANRIAVDAASLVEGARSAVVTPSDTLDQQIDALAQSATEGSTAIARALQQIQNIDANTGEAGLKREQDIALDIGDQLVAIAEATTVKQLDAAKRRVAGLARDNSLIIENETNLQNLLLVAESQFQERKIALITEAGRQAASERIRQEVEAEREASAQGLIERQRAAQRAREQARRATTQLLTQSNEQIGDVLSQLRDADISGDQFASLNVQFEMLVANLDNLGVAVPNIARLRDELAGIADLRIDDQLSGLAEATLRSQEAAFAGASQAGEQLTRRLLEGGEAVQREFARKRVQATRQVVRQIESIESRFTQAQSVNSLERLQNDTRQLRSELQQRGQAWQAHTDRVTALSRDIGDSLDEALRTERLEKFQDAVANVVSDLAQTGFDFIFDSIFDRSQQATDAVKTFTDDVRGDIQLLESDIRRITRFDEDRGLGAARLQEDRDRAVRQLQFRLREAAGQQIFGDQRALQRNRERQQDVRFRLRERREDFDVRIGRFGEDTGIRRGRLLEDATRNRERFEARPEQENIVEKLGESVYNALSRYFANKVAGWAVTGLTSFFAPLFGKLFDQFFDGGDDTPPVPDPTPPKIDGTTPSTDTASTPSLTAPTESLEILSHSMPMLTAPTESLSVLTHSTPTLTAPLTSLAVLTASTPALTAPLTSLEVLTHSTPMLTAPASLDLSGVAVSKIMPIFDTSMLDLKPDDHIDAPTGITPVIEPPNRLNPDDFIDDPSKIKPEFDSPDRLNSDDFIDKPSDIKPKFDSPDRLNPDDFIDKPADIPTKLANPTRLNPDDFIDPATPIPTTFADPARLNPDDFIDPATPIPTTFADPARLNPNAFVDPFVGVKPFFNVTDPLVNFNPNLFVTPLDPITPIIELPDKIDLSNIPVIPPQVVADETGERGTGQGGDRDIPDRFIDRAPGQGRGAVPGGGEGSGGGFLNALSSLKDSIESGLESGLSALPDSVEGVVRSILGAGVSVGGDGVGLSAGGSALTDEQVEALAASLAEGLGESFRSDFIPTLMGNQPGQVQPGSADPDEDIAQAPAAPRFDQAAASISAIANVLSLDALAGVAQELTLAQANFELLALRTFVENGLPPAIGREFTQIATDLAQETTLALIPQLQRTHLIQQGFGIDEEIKGRATMNELLTQALERPAGTSEDKLYVTLAGETLKVEGQVEVVGGQMDVNAQIINSSPISVSTGTVQVVISGQPVSVRIEDLGTLLSQISQANTERSAFGGLTI